MFPASPGLSPTELRAIREGQEAEIDVSAGEDRARYTRPPSADQLRLAQCIRDRFPALKVSHSSENHVELSESRLSVQIYIFQRAAGISLHPGGYSTAKYIESLQLAWGSLEILQREGGFATYDTQIDRFLDLATDFETVLACYGGQKAVKLNRAEREKLEQSHAWQLAKALETHTAMPYSANATYAVGDVVRHPTLGAGIVRALAPKRATILFEVGTKILVCGA
ncbi:MAG: hypothetical protein H0V17_30600 [Deltaproteobacteria bacterium]|nr:hypothetical protein [Deltaproteobacteria bacterium]